MAGQRDPLRHASAGDADVPRRHRRRPARRGSSQSDDPNRGALPPRPRRTRRRVRRRRRSRVRLPALLGRARRRRRPTTSTTGARSTPATCGSWSPTTARSRSRSATAPITACSASRTRSTAATPTTAIRIRCATSACASSRCERTRHASGIARLHVVRELDEIGTLTVDACVAPGVPFVRCEVALDNRAPDHRLRLRFPTGAAGRRVRRRDDVRHRSSFDRARRRHRLGPSRAAHLPAPGLDRGRTASSSARPGLPEAEVTPAGEVLVTLVRSVGALAAHRAAHPPAARRPRDDGTRRADPGPRRRHRHARPHARRCARRRDRSPRRPRRRNAAGRRRRLAARARRRSTRCCRRASPRRTATGSWCACSTRPTSPTT